MDSQDLKQRATQVFNKPIHEVTQRLEPVKDERHPAGRVKHGIGMQLLRGFFFFGWFILIVIGIHTTQWVGVPLYWIDRDYYYAWMALTKQHFALALTAACQWFAPTTLRLSGDASVRGRLRLDKQGQLETDFGERLILIANHQIYTDWLYLWWIAYRNDMHGHIFIILKESIKYIPLIGWGCSFYGFIFMARNWARDKPRMQHRLKQLSTNHHGPLSGSSSQTLDPMWLLLFPEGTNLSANTRKGSAKWAAKQGIPDLKHLLLPRSTGLRFCLEELNGNVEYIYDCTVGYEGVPYGGYAQDYFTLRSTFFQGRTPKSISMHWRRFAVSSIPVHDHAAFEKWVAQLWLEKEDLLEYYHRNGHFPTDPPIETRVGLTSYLELAQIFAVVAIVLLLWYTTGKAMSLVRGTA